MDSFLNADGPLSFTTNAAHPSPDKTTMSCISSSDLPKYTGASYDDASKNLLRVEIESATQKPTNFYVPVSLMLQREIEMQATARGNRIGKERWSSSRLFRLWKRQQLVSQQTTNNYASDGGEIILQVNPELTFQNSKLNSSFRWKPWLTTCLRSYYACGNLRIPDECTGEDILLTLEYFGILTNDFLFDSRHAFGRIQAWSRYFTYRILFANTLLEDYNDVAVEGNDTVVWVIFQENEQDDLEIIDQKACGQISACESLNLNGKNIRRLTVGETGGLYDLFCGRRGNNNQYTGEMYEENILTKHMPSRMRHDFCEYMKQSLPPNSKMRFDIKRMEVISRSNTNRAKDGAEIRPVIYIERDLGNCTATTTQDKLVNSPRFRTFAATKIIAPTYGSQLKSSLLDTEFKNNNSSIMKTFHSKGSPQSNNARSDLQNSDVKNNVNTPINYVNIELGDLRSVTSVLSEPVVDDSGALNELYSTIESMNNNKVKQYDQAKRIIRERCTNERTCVEQISRRMAQERSNTKKNLSEESACFVRSISTLKTPQGRTTRDTPSLDKEQCSTKAEERKKGVSSKRGNKKVAVNEERNNSEVQVNESKESECEGSEASDENLDAQCIMVQLLACMCESIIPSQSRNHVSHSSIRQSLSVSSSDDEHQNFFVCPAREGAKSTSNKPNNFVDKAKKIGSDLSKQFDDLMRVAYDGSDQEETKDSLSPTPEEIPELLAIHTDEDRTMTSCLTSSVVGLPSKSRTSRNFEVYRQKSDKFVSDKFTNDTAYAIPKSKPFDVDSFNKPTMALPHRLGEHRSRTSRKKRALKKKANVSLPKCEAKVHLSRDGHKSYQKTK